MLALRVTAIAALVTIGCASGSSSSSASEPPIEATGVIILANHCGHLSKEASRATEETLSQLTKPCNTVLKEPLTFRVVLDPSGSIGFARAADAGSDEIPLCVVTQKLQHHVRLKSACVIDVRFEPMSIAPAHT
jgi:hypothetical protein